MEILQYTRNVDQADAMLLAWGLQFDALDLSLGDEGVGVSPAQADELIEIAIPAEFWYWSAVW